MNLLPNLPKSDNQEFNLDEFEKTLKILPETPLIYKAPRNNKVQRKKLNYFLKNLINKPKSFKPMSSVSITWNTTIK